MPARIESIPVAKIFESLNDGLYVCDRDRRILFWSKSAERITGWRPEEVVGRRCKDNVLNHVDKDGRSLCGEEFCPLYRSMCTGKGSRAPSIIFGQTSTGGRIPMAVSVAPIHGADGEVIGGVETFRDFSDTYADLMRAKRIQQLSMPGDLPHDSRLSCARFYLPHDVIGGDYCAIEQLDEDRYGFLLADVMGHGVAAALYTMHLSALWSQHRCVLGQPAEFARRVNRDLSRVVRDESFATGICGILDASRRSVRLVSAGGPALAWFQAAGGVHEVNAPGCPFGMVEEAEYEEINFCCATGDRMLMFTDGAVEIHNAAGQMLGRDGLLNILADHGYPGADLAIEPLQKDLLRFSNEICLSDDLTLLDIRFT